MEKNLLISKIDFRDIISESETFRIKTDSIFKDVSAVGYAILSSELEKLRENEFFAKALDNHTPTVFSTYEHGVTIFGWGAIKFCDFQTYSKTLGLDSFYPELSEKWFPKNCFMNPVIIDCAFTFLSPSRNWKRIVIVESLQKDGKFEFSVSHGAELSKSVDCCLNVQAMLSVPTAESMDTAIKNGFYLAPYKNNEEK